MDKRKVIHAYRRGFISMQECAQILGIDSQQILGIMSESGWDDSPRTAKPHPAKGSFSAG